MRKKRLPIGLCMLIFTIQGFSQIKEFDLSRYQLPELERRTLEFDFNLGGDNSGMEFRDDFSEYIIDDAHNNFNGNVGARYTYYLNNNRFQKQTYASVYLRSDFGNHKNEGELVFKNFQFCPSFNIDHVSRRLQWKYNWYKMEC